MSLHAKLFQVKAIKNREFKMSFRERALEKLRISKEDKKIMEMDKLFPTNADIKNSTIDNWKISPFMMDHERMMQREIEKRLPVRGKVLEIK